MNELTVNESMNKILQAISQQTANVNAVLGAVGVMGKRIDDIATEVGDLKGDVEILKNEEEIKTKQAKELRHLINRIVSRRIGVNENKKKRTFNEVLIDRKYRSIFSSALYTEVPKMGHLASPYSTTAKKDFIEACRDVENWYPAEGIEGLKRRADEMAAARLIAKEQGY